MLSMEQMRKVVEFALENRNNFDIHNQNSEINDELLRDSDVLSEFKKPRDWVQNLFQDIWQRHITFRSPFEDVILRLLEQVNYRLMAGKMRSHTIVPIRGLMSNLWFSDEIPLYSNLKIRRIHHSEWDQFIRFTFERVDDSLPQYCLEWVEDEDPQFYSGDIDDNSFQNIIDQTNSFISLLQLQQAQPMSPSCIIKYIPKCYTDSLGGHFSAINFPSSPGDRIGYEFSKKHFEVGSENFLSLIKKEQNLYPSVKLALKRLHDATNRINNVDSHIDLWIALEALLGPEKTGGDYSRGLCKRIASFLFDNVEQRKIAYRWLYYYSYEFRSRIVHGDRYDEMIFDHVHQNTSTLVRVLIQKILQENNSYDDVISNIEKRSVKTNYPKLPKDPIQDNDFFNLPNNMDDLLEKVLLSI